MRNSVISLYFQESSIIWKFIIFILLEIFSRLWLTKEKMTWTIKEFQYKFKKWKEMSPSMYSCHRQLVQFWTSRFLEIQAGKVFIDTVTLLLVTNCYLQRISDFLFFLKAKNRLRVHRFQRIENIWRTMVRQV